MEVTIVVGKSHVNSCIPCFQYTCTCMITKSFADHIIGRKKTHKKSINRVLQIGNYRGNYNSQQQLMQLFPHRVHYCKIQIQLQNILLCIEYTSFNRIFLKFVNYCIIIQYVTHLAMKLLLLMYLTSGINRFFYRMYHKNMC